MPPHPQARTAQYRPGRWETLHGIAVDLTDLYRGPLGEFIERRARLAREAASADPAEAAAIRKLRKPPVSVWAIDQVAIEQRDLIAELLAAGADASDAQRAVAAQIETRESLLAASRRLRDAVETAATAADRVLETAGHARSDQTARQIRTTLQSAATGAAADRLALWHGSLDHEVESTGFGALDAPDDDPPELAGILARLRRTQPAAKRAGEVTRAPAEDDREQQRAAAERAAKKQAEVAERLRDLANAKRLHADTLAEEARQAGQEASAAEDAAEQAETEARALRSNLSR